MFDTMCIADSVEGKKIIKASIKYLEKDPNEYYISENHSFFLFDAKKVIIKKYSNEEIARAINSMFIGTLINDKVALKSYGVISNNKNIYLISEYLLRAKLQNIEKILSINLESLSKFHYIISKKYDNVKNNRGLFINDSGVEPVMPAFEYKQEFIERAILTRPSDKNKRFDMLSTAFQQEILDEYDDMFGDANNLSESESIMHGDFRLANVINGTLIDFDHVRKTKYLEYDYARGLAHSLILPIREINDIVKSIKTIDIQNFWNNYFHHNITLAAYAHANNDSLNFNNYVDKSFEAAKKINSNLTNTIKEYLMPLKVMGVL